jgi:hypothetical protein
MKPKTIAYAIAVITFPLEVVTLALVTLAVICGYFLCKIYGSDGK